MTTGIQRAVEAAGSVQALAIKLGVTHQAIYKFLRQGWVPPARAMEIETHYAIPRQELVSPRLLGLVGMPMAGDFVA